MAIYHLSGQVISRSQGRSAVACASYRSAEKLIDERTEITHDYAKKAHDILHKEIMLPTDAPEWMKDRNKLWNAVEAGEKRKDAQLAREFNIALPKELTHEQNIALARGFVQKEFVDKGMVADLCIHKGHTGTEEQPHIHVMLTMREVTVDGFGQKNRDWNDKNLLEQWRESWANTVNKELALSGHDFRIDHRSNAERGIDLEPQYKIGSKVASHKMANFEDHQRIAKENGEKIFANPALALDAITKQQSTFTHQDLARFINRHTIDAEQFQKVYDKVKGCEHIVYLGKDEQGRERFTTQEMLALEKKMLGNVESLQKDRANCHLLNHIHAAPKHFGEEQRAALEHMLSRGDIKCVIGYAGSGKSTILNEAREAWEKEGFKVHGVTLSGIAAENLTGASGIESRTFASRLYYWDKGEQALTNKDILVVDEAGMLGSRQMARLLEEAHAGNAKVVLIGDPQQLQAIEAGAAFRAITEQTNYVELTQVRRQHEKWQQEATKEFAQGAVDKALNRYDQHHNLHEFDTQTQAKQNLVEMWNDARISNPEKTQIILSYTRKDAQELNELARDLRRENNELGKDHAFKTERGERQFAENDRIYFLKNERSLGVMNGTLGTIEKIDGNNITVRLDKDLENPNSRAVVVDTNLYKHIDHGYAATIHKAQGVTVDRSYVLASKYMDSHSSYVALSRHREGADLFWGKDEFAKPQDLFRTFSRDRSKDVSLDYGVENPKALQQEIKTEIAKDTAQERIRETSREKHHQSDRLLTSAEIKERYGLENKHDVLHDLKKSHEAKTSLEKEFDPIQAFKAKYEAQNPEKARGLQESLRPGFEKRALAVEKEISLLERAIEKSNMPRTHQQQLEKYAAKISKDREVMHYLNERKPELAKKISGIAKEHDRSRAWSFERDRGGRSW